MNYTKTNPNISYQEFYELASQVKLFKSFTDKKYDVQNLIGDEMSFVNRTHSPALGLLLHMRLLS